MKIMLFHSSSLTQSHIQLNEIVNRSANHQIALQILCRSSSNVATRSREVIIPTVTGTAGLAIAEDLARSQQKEQIFIMLTAQKGDTTALSGSQ